ncbi:MAG: hypothetical protein LWW81_08220 [Rhodocyclales bacterium]|nr:hypothetical protein [Rhodocyclales bacterium]
MDFRRIKAWQWILLLLVALATLDWAIQRPDGATRALNEALAMEASPELQKYPYPFHVFRIEGKTAVMGTPRNFDMPAFRFLGAMYPDVNVKDANNPAFIALQNALGKAQDEARDIVLRQPGIESVRWELDRDWLRRHYIEVPDKP